MPSSKTTKKHGVFNKGNETTKVGVADNKRSDKINLRLKITPKSENPKKEEKG